MSSAGTYKTQGTRSDVKPPIAALRRVRTLRKNVGTKIKHKLYCSKEKLFYLRSPTMPKGSLQGSRRPGKACTRYIISTFLALKCLWLAEAFCIASFARL